MSSEDPSNQPLVPGVSPAVRASAARGGEISLRLELQELQNFALTSQRSRERAASSQHWMSGTFTVLSILLASAAGITVLPDNVSRYVSATLASSQP